MPPKGRLKRLPRPLRPFVQLPLDLVRRTRQRLAVATRPLRPDRLRATWAWYADLQRRTAQRRSESRLTVAVDIEPLWEQLTGVGWYLYCLLDRLKDRDDVLLRLYGPWMVEETPPPCVELPRGRALEVVRYEAPRDLSLKSHWLVRILRCRARRLVAADGNQVVFLPNYVAPDRFSRATGALAVTVHDLAFRRLAWAVRDNTRRWLEASLESTLRRAAIILTDSRTVAREIRDSGLAGSTPVVPVLLGSGRLGAPESECGHSDGRGACGAASVAPGRIAEVITEVTAELGLDTAGYALHVGTIEPRKNLPTLLRVWDRWRQRRDSAPPLLLVGRFGWETDELKREIERGCREGWLAHLGYVDDRRMAALYGGARFLVFPSHYEGFGFPLVEAMALGTPVVASDIAVFKEVAESAALFVPPDDEVAWLAALERIDRDDELREQLRGVGRDRARELDWARTAEQTLEAFRDIASAERAGLEDPG